MGMVTHHLRTQPACGPAARRRSACGLALTSAYSKPVTRDACHRNHTPIPSLLCSPHQAASTPASLLRRSRSSRRPPSPCTRAVLRICLARQLGFLTNAGGLRHGCVELRHCLGGLRNSLIGLRNRSFQPVNLSMERLDGHGLLFARLLWRQLLPGVPLPSPQPYQCELG